MKIKSVDHLEPVWLGKENLCLASQSAVGLWDLVGCVLCQAPVDLVYMGHV